MKNNIKTSGFVLSLINLFDEAACRQLLFDLTRGSVCRYCKTPVQEKHLKRFYKGKEIYCKNCGSRFLPAAGTILSQSKISYRRIMLMLAMLDMGFKTKDVAAAVAVAPHTVPHWRRKLEKWMNKNE